MRKQKLRVKKETEKMIGIYDYSVILTYLSAISAGIGIIVSLNGEGHPYVGTFFLLICGLCDAFDGVVARTKKNRTLTEKKYGIQIDSLSDLIAFGVLPGCIGNAMICVSSKFPELPHIKTQTRVEFGTATLLFAIILWYILAALIRLAYFNVTEEERQGKEAGNRKYFEGLPVTSSALVFPLVMLMQYLIPMDITPIYFVVMFLMSFMFVLKIKIPKPQFRGVLIMCGIGLIEFLAMLIFRYFI